tara:strand:+ start:412 stop:1137 length:726 start_codon:yes stop_codon:yes gene_type:complete
MKILTWNIWYKEDPKNVLELLKSTEWDVCCLQEVMRGFHPEVEDVTEYLKKNLCVEGYFAIAQGRSEKGWSQGNLILSRLPIADTFSYFIQDKSDDLEPSFSDEGRVVTGIELENSLKILATHMSYTPQFEETAKKNTESERLTEYLKELEQPFVFCGDLNAVPTSNLIQNLSQDYKNLSPNFTEPTWTTKPFSHEGFEVDTLTYRLDYMFGSKEVEMIDSKIIQTKFSDHLPILTEIKNN